MTVIDRAHRAVLLLVVTAVPAIFLVDFVVELVTDRVTMPPGWEVYLLLISISGYQLRRKNWNADLILMGGGLGTAAMGLLSHFGQDTVLDPITASVLTLILALLIVGLGRRAPRIMGLLLGLAMMGVMSLGLANAK